jgi:L-fuconate dehydratase
LISGDSQLRWLGPEKGVIHLATGAMVNAIWDLYAKIEGKPVWKLVYDMSPEKLLSCIDFTYLTDAITPAEALSLLKEKEKGKSERLQYLLEKGYPAYTTSAGWLGYSEEKIKRLCKEAIAEGWSHIKMKVGADIKEDIKRAAIIRNEIGYERQLMMDANQKWEVKEAIDNMNQLSQFKPLWIEEPTSPDDILGHKAIGTALHPIKIATGEHCHNRVMFKQFITSGALDICQIDSCRVGGVNELLAILLLAAKYKVPVCPHAGGVGLCEYVQHLSMIDYLCISGTMEDRIIEYVDHLHEHFHEPVKIKEGCYMPPQEAGYSITMKNESLERFEYPHGKYWREEHNLVGLTFFEKS